MSETYDASDPKAVREAKAKAKSKDLIAIEGLKATMGTEAGRLWLFTILDACGVFINAFSPDPGVMAFRCGEQNIGLQLISDMHEASPELYMLMLKENNK